MYSLIAVELLRLTYHHREYFTNRAAAKAVKAKIEALERGSVTRYSDQKYSIADIPAEYHDQMKVMKHREDVSSTDNHGRPQHSLDPEARIALIRAQREQEKEKSIIERERLVCTVLYYIK